MKAIKVRLYPTLKQEELINKTIGCARFIYNQMLNERISFRVFHCEKCGLVIDRDLNAAINIKNFKSDELSDYGHGETVNLINKFFNFNISSFVEVITQPINKCNVC